MRLLLAPPALALAAAAPAASAQSLPPGFEAVPLPGAYHLPTNLAFAPDGSLFVLEKPGTVRLLRGGSLQSVPFLDLAAEVNNEGDRGLLGLALHPGWVPDGGPTSWVYLSYTVSPVLGEDVGFSEDDLYSFSRLARWRAVQAGGIVVADLASRHVLLGHQEPSGAVPDAIASLHSSHSNGSLVFGADGSLLIATGDGAHFDLTDVGGFDDPGFDDWLHPETGLVGPTPAVQDVGAFRSRDLRSLSGKVLRLDPETGLGYPSNPFWNGDGASNPSRVWAMGLRNPFRMDLVPGSGAADPALGQPGTLVLGDVGAAKWEELNVCVGGEDFGWPCVQGPEIHGPYATYDAPAPDFPDCDLVSAGVPSLPAVAWHHDSPEALQPAGIHLDEDGTALPGFVGRCAIGGTFYAGGDYPEAYVGRYFFGDYDAGWIRTLELDAGGRPTAVHPFATGIGTVAAFARDPASGDVHVADVKGGRLFRLRHTANPTPVVVAAAAPTAGPLPLVVQLDGTGSYDPGGGELDFAWDLGDGAGSTEPAPTHVYAEEGVYEVSLTVTEPDGATATSEPIPIFAGNVPPAVALVSPTQGGTYPLEGELLLEAAASDPEGTALAYAWQIDLHHDDHVHPGTFLSDQPTDAFPIDAHADDGALLYYRVELTVTDAGGLSSSAHAFVYADGDVEDVTGTSPLVSKVAELFPPGSLGGGNEDVEVVRDGVLPPAGSDPLLQYSTWHEGDQGDDDWLGFELSFAPGSELRFVGLTFQEGEQVTGGPLHLPDGGWFDTLGVEVRDGVAWRAAENVVITPPYPFGPDASGFDVYRLDFDPLHGDAVRLRGDPGGAGGFVSVAELRAHAVRLAPPTPYEDLTPRGAIVAKVLTLSPPGPQGFGNAEPETIRNGTTPPAGSQSSWGQWSTAHGGDQGDDDWVGYLFGEPRTLARVVFQEGRHWPEGGAFDAFGVEVREPGGGWVAATGLRVDPPYPGLELGFASYDTFTLDFDPVLATGVRLRGDPAGTEGFVTVGELRVLGPAAPEGCGWEAYGEGLGGANTLALASDTAPGLGLPVVLRASGSEGASAGFLLASLAEEALPLLGGTLLVSLEPTESLLLPIAFDASGEAEVALPLPADPAHEGTTLSFQAAALGAAPPATVRLSHGLRATLCAWP